MTTKLAYEDVLDKFNAGTVTGKYGGIYVILVNPDTGLPYAAGGGGGGGGDASAANQLKTIGPGLTPGSPSANATLAAGTYNAQATRRVLTEGQQASLSLGQNGQMLTTITDSISGSPAQVTTGNVDAIGASTIGLVVRSLASVFNGTTWDRQRGNTKGTFMIGAPLTGTDRSVAVGTSSVTLAAANATRAGFVMQNLSTTADIWYAFGVAAVVGGLGSFRLPPGATWFMESNVIDVADIRVIATAVATNLSAREY